MHKNGHHKFPKFATANESFLVAQLLLVGLLALLEARIAGARKLVLEFLDASGGVNELQLARVKRMAHVANIDLQFFPRAARGKGVATATVDTSFVILGMDFSLHDFFLAARGSP